MTLVGLYKPKIDPRKRAAFRAIAERIVEELQMPHHASNDLSEQENAPDLPSAEDIALAIEARERVGMTATPERVAFPRGAVAGMSGIAVCVCLLEAPIAFDNVSVDLVVALVAPDVGFPRHNQLLASFVRQLREPKVCERLRRVKSADELCMALRDEHAAAAA